MEWLNIRLTQLSAPEYLRSDPTERATWLQLLAHCAGQENGGTIRDCADWKDRVWQQIAGVTLKEVKATCRLWTWDGTDLHVWGYPGEKERLIRFNRATGRTGGITKAINRLKAQISPEVLAVLEPTLQGLEPETLLATLQATVTGSLAQPLQATVEGSLLRKGKEGEGKGKEGEGNKQQLQQQPAPDLPTENRELRTENRDRGIDLAAARTWADTFNRSNAEGIHIPMPVITAWHDDRTAAGWNTVRDGTEFPIRDWQADLRRYARKWQQNERNVNATPSRNGNRPAPAPPLTTGKKNGF
jgi:hypothetical protein